MTEAEIITLVNDSLANEFELDPAKMRPEANLFTDLELDSLDIVDLVIILENSFGFKIREDPKLREIRTLADVYSYVLDKTRQAGKDGTAT